MDITNTKDIKEQLEKYKKKAEKKEYLADYNSGFYDGFDSALNLLLPLVEALEAWNNWENNQIAKEGPYAGKEINELINGAQKALQELREKLK